MAETLTRQTRSNSLQRMLNLEKQYDRRRTAPTQSFQSGVTVNNLSSQSRPTTQGRQIETQSVQDRRRSDHRQRSFPLQTQPPRPQLVIHVNTTSSQPPHTAIQEPQNNMKVRRSSKNIPTSPPSIPYSSTVEALPTPVSGAQSSVCQSPSWEAYDRRKQEKKEEKKSKVEAKTAKKPRRLSKAPPASSLYAFEHMNLNQSETAVTDNGRGTRPASMVISDSPSKEESFYQQPRSRAGSFSSLIKSTFDFRRSSIDQSQDRPFIGGIKLEYEQHLANERALNQQSTPDETDVHPALRKPKAGSSSALKSPPPPSRATNSNQPNSRAYPPNTFKTAKSHSMFPMSPTAPAIPDLSTIEKWRARVGLKPTNKSSPPTSPLQTPQMTEPTLVSDTHGLQEAIDTCVEKQNKCDMEPTKKPVGGQESARKTPPPPEPPRRSSKRYSTFNGSPSMPLLNPAVLRVAPGTASSSAYDLSSAADPEEIKQPSASPSWENLQSSVMNTIERTIKPLGGVEREEGEKAFWNSREWAIHRPDFPHLTSSSSEDSASESFNTASMPSTPNTSRPQSEQGLPRCSGESERHTLPRIQLHDNSYPSEACSFVSASSFTAAYDTDREVDPIQAAARKVMAALPPMPAANPASVGFEHEPLQLRSKLTDTSSMPDCSLMEIPKLTPKNPKAQPAKRAKGDTIAKVFVECCGCKYYHDMPSRLYDAMVDPNSVLSPSDQSDFAGAISMTVKCPWCKHAMSTSCCAGLAAMVYVKERLH